MQIHQHDAKKHGASLRNACFPSKIFAVNTWTDSIVRFSRRQGHSVAALLLYSVLSVILTYPVIRNLWHAVPGDLGDPLLNLWILGWDLHKGLQFADNDFWQANVFYPAPDVLAYSEHLYASALLGLPVYLFSGSLILTYNLLFLSSFVLSGWGMYLLVKDLTEREAPALVCGTIFAFCPFRFAHLWHLQLLTSQWIPFVFLFLNRFLKRSSYTNVLLFTLFFLLQALACGYYALFTGLFVGLFIGYHLYTQRELLRWDLCRKLLISVFAILLCASPFLYPYLQARRLYGLSRSVGETIQFSADLTSYICAPPINKLWGPITQQFDKIEGQLHPGLTLIVLAAVGAVVSFKRGQAAPPQRRMAGFALLTAISALTLSLGPKIHLLGRFIFPGPYFFVYMLVPGFDGLRVPARLALFFVFGAALLAGYGIRAIMQHTRNPKWIVSILGALVLVEYFSVPIPMATVPGKGEPLPVYQWLGRQTGNLPIVELPIQGLDVEYNYFSVFHWKDLVNGYSGYFPPWFRPMRTLMEAFPSSAALDFLEEIGVRFVIVHTGKLVPEANESIASASSHFDNRLRRIESFGEDEVYEVIQAEKISRATAAQRLADRMAQRGVDPGPLKEFSQELSSAAPPKTLRVNETVRMPVSVKNTGKVPWPAFGFRDISPVHLAYHWLDETGRMYQRDGERTGLPHVLAPAEEISLRAIVQAPPQPGRFILRLTMLQENVAWFDARGGEPLDIPVVVTKPETP
jgi:hypothetical protein